MKRPYQWIKDRVLVQNYKYLPLLEATANSNWSETFIENMKRFLENNPSQTELENFITNNL